MAAKKKQKRAQPKKKQEQKEKLPVKRRQPWSPRGPAAKGWSTQQEIDYTAKRLADSKEQLADHQNQVWALEALVRCLEDGLARARLVLAGE